MALKLPRLQRTAPIADSGGKPTIAFHIWWNETADTIETQEGIQDEVIEQLEQAQADLAATQADLAATQADLTAAVADIATLQGDVSGIESTAVIKDQGPSWIDATGTAARTALASYAGQVVSNPPTQAQVQQIDDAVKAISQHLVAVINDLKSNGALT